MDGDVIAGQIITLFSTIFTALMMLRTHRSVADVGIALNGRIAKLIESVRAAAIAEGVEHAR